MPLAKEDLARTRAAAYAALATALRHERPEADIDGGGYAATVDDNLVEGLTPENRQQVETDFRGGRGDEFGGARPKFAAAHSSAGLAANAFARWRNDPEDLRHLRLAGAGGFSELRFEVQLPTGLRGIPPNLDAVAAANDLVVGVESKCTEFLSEKKASFSDAYAAPFGDAHSSWRAAYQAAVADPEAFRLLAVAQLLKHYLGLKQHAKGRRAILFYVYWEPENASEHSPFVEHRAELARFADSVADPHLEFRHQSHPELWASWEGGEAPAWVAEHVQRLRRRYFVRL